MNLESLIGKKAIRALGIAESFRLGISKSILVGVVMRSDGLIDGIAINKATIGGLDSTDAIIELVDKLGRKDLQIIMLDGCIISWYNIVDLEKLHKVTNLPIICLTFEKIEGDVEEAIRKIFPDWQVRIELFKKLEKPKEIILKNGMTVYARLVGIDYKLARTVLNKFVKEGKKPEPIRIAKLVANSILNHILT